MVNFRSHTVHRVGLVGLSITIGGLVAGPGYSLFFSGSSPDEPGPAPEQEKKALLMDAANFSQDEPSPPAVGKVRAPGSGTELSLRAMVLSTGTAKTAVLELLGPPSWAVTAHDTASANPDVPLALLWANGPCPPVTVDFSAGGEVTGLDPGRTLCFEDPPLEYPLVPGDEYACSQADRVELCQSNTAQ